MYGHLPESGDTTVNACTSYRNLTGNCSICRFDGTQLLIPTKTEIMKHKIIVTTLLTARVLFLMGIKKGHFSHILIDEAAQVIIYYLNVHL